MVPPPKSITFARVSQKIRNLTDSGMSYVGLRNPVVPQEAGMARFQKKGLWRLDAEQCPCDLHFLDYLKAESAGGKAIFHFGTGDHHILGLENARFAQPNDILGITAAEMEHGSYVNHVVSNPRLALHYQVWFADIYTLSESLLPEFDLITLFHLGEFHMPQHADRVHHDDESLLRMMCRRLRPGGTILLYSGSFAWPKAEALAEKLASENQLAAAGDFQSLRLYKRPVDLSPSQGARSY